ncbi:MAG: bacteriohemerythrin [Sporomusaceae bacterium]|nr:bacteriohemerythrin [Sporomusaceae bacterium]
MDLIEWNSNFSVYVPEIDEEHKNLIEMINSLRTSIKSGNGKDTMQVLLNELNAYTLQHINHEEALMMKFNYPQYPEHKNIHNAFIKSVKDLYDLHTQDLLKVNQFLNFLQEWLINHIWNTDMHYSGFFQKAMRG